MKIELKNFSYNDKLSEETYCFSASIYIDGKKVGDCYGASTLIHFNDPKIAKQFYAYCNSLPPLPANPAMGYSVNGRPLDIPMNGELFIDGLVENLLKAKEDKRANAQLKRWCTTQTVVIMKGAKLGEYTCFKAKFSPEVKAKILAKYGDKIEKFVNETI